MDSVAARACEKISGMLAAGPRSAAEIIAAVEGDGSTARTAQRAAISLGVVKAKAGLRGGWTWSLPADDAPTEQAPSTPTDGEVRVRVAADRDDGKVTGRVERAEVIAARLRKLEAGRGKTAPIYAADPRLLRWVEAGISDPDLREAYELAAFKIGGGGPVTVGYLDRFVSEVLAETKGAG